MKRAFRLLVLPLFVIFLSQCNMCPPAKPRMVVLIVVDQFRYDYLTRFRSEYNGGIARLLDQGAVFADARYQHYPTVTAVGHSTILSGATPSVSGIIGNEWYERHDSDPGCKVTSVSVGCPEKEDKAERKSSPERLLVSTLGDELKMANRNSRVIGISIKARSAILPSGRMADAAYWFDKQANQFITGTYYMSTPPKWVSDVNAAGPAKAYAGKQWVPLNGGRPFCVFDKADASCDSIEKTPFANEILEDFAEKAIEKEDLGKPGTTDLLTLSFSANDYVGHDHGPDSDRLHDITLRTDRILARFLNFLDQRFGKDVLVVFTADHGVSPSPKANNDRRMPGDYLYNEAVADKIADCLTKGKKGPDWFAFAQYGSIYLNDQNKGNKGRNIADTRRQVADCARQQPHVARAFTYDDLIAGRAAGDPVGRAVQLGFYGSRAADVVMVPEPYFIFVMKENNDPLRNRTYTSHATPYSYDNHVPLIFYGAGIRKGTYYEPVAMNDVAPTLAAMLRVETPSGSSGRILKELMPEGR